VTIAYGLAVAKYDITFAEWDACVAAGGCKGYRPDDAGWGRDDRPVVNVSWDDAQSYLQWLSDKTGRQYRLLSESEWEYAARAGTTTAYYWGDSVGRGHANCTGCGNPSDGKQTTPVGSFAPNPFGLYDMSGNVLQWVTDCFFYLYDGPTDGSVRPGSGCRGKVLRGGSWYRVPPTARSASRRAYGESGRTNYYGFRVARAY
jgi:formylglycine-generating enzyme required for sulfatase activity